MPLDSEGAGACEGRYGRGEVRGGSGVGIREGVRVTLLSSPPVTTRKGRVGRKPHAFTL